MDHSEEKFFAVGFGFYLFSVAEKRTESRYYDLWVGRTPCNYLSYQKTMQDFEHATIRDRSASMQNFVFYDWCIKTILHQAKKKQESKCRIRNIIHGKRMYFFHKASKLGY